MKRIFKILSGGIPISDRRWLGMKIAFVGFLVAMVGSALTFFGFNKVGYWLFMAGWFIGLVGVIFHIPVVLRSMRVPVDRKETGDKH